MKEKVITVLNSLDLDNFMVRKNIAPHTQDVAELTSSCEGRTTSEYYLLGKYYDLIDSNTAIQILLQLQALQDMDKNSPTYCCMRWYREEWRVDDKNGAFFGFKPVIMAYLFCREKMCAEEKNIIEEMMKVSYKWFMRCCEHPELYYPNRIMSDGAMLTAISYLLQNKEGIEKSNDFWKKWLKYTDNHGWGWGENTSACYCSVMIEALDLTLCTIKNDEIFAQLLEKKQILLSYAAFHGTYEFVPSIRTYNMGGSDKNYNSIYYMTGNMPDSVKCDTSFLMSFLLFDNAPKCQIIDYDEKFHAEKIFDSSYAKTWKGENIRLGTVSLFPTLPGCYQHGTKWGIGWQSMPVSVLCISYQTSFLRYKVFSLGKERSHIATVHHDAYLSTHLFSDNNVPDFRVLCEQKDNLAIVSKTMHHLANSASYIADEWFVQNFCGSYELYNGWYIIRQGVTVTAVKPINGMDSNGEFGLVETKDICENNSLRICQIIYSGDEKLVVTDKVETAWIIGVWENEIDIKKTLDSIKIDEKYYELEEAPVDVHHINVNDISLLS